MWLGNFCFMGELTQILRGDFEYIDYTHIFKQAYDLPEFRKSLRRKKLLTYTVGKKYFPLKLSSGYSR